SPISFTTLFYSLLFFFFFNSSPTTDIYTLSLHDALPISPSFHGDNDSDFSYFSFDHFRSHAGRAATAGAGRCQSRTGGCDHYRRSDPWHFPGALRKGRMGNGRNLGCRPGGQSTPLYRAMAASFA